jgi:hypothetical protein
MDTDVPAPEPLARLAADWPALLRPVRVQRWLGMTVPEAQRWLVLETGEAEAGDTVLASTKLGAGRVLVQTVPLHTAWTNLPTKPVMVPLVHETLRTTIGPEQRLIVAGDQPTLGQRWTGTDRLVPIRFSEGPDSGQAGSDQPSNGSETADGGDAADTGLAVGTEDADLRLAAAFHEPGPYRAADTGRALAVNPDPAAGDLRDTSRQQLTSWFDRLAGDRWAFLPADNPASMLAQATQRASLGWPLLWAVMGLAIVELLLARHFAHAQRSDQPRVRDRMLGLWRHLRHLEHTPGARSGR